VSDEAISIPTADWLKEWDRTVDPTRLRAYVDSELRRLRAEGAPLVHLSVMLPLSQQQDLALSVLRQMGYRPLLRLREGASPPLVDYDGKPLPKAQQGTVLRAKVGVHGDDPSLKHDPIRAREFAGPNLRHLQRTTGLYRHVDVTAEPQPYTVEEASVILRQWGVGVRAKRMRGNGKRDCWLVEEVVQRAAPAQPRRARQVEAPL